MTKTMWSGLGVLALLLLAPASASAQPAPTGATCAKWRAVNPTAANPFGRECTQWAPPSKVGEVKVKKQEQTAKHKRGKVKKRRR